MRAYREILTIPGAWKFCVAGLLARTGGAMMGLGIVLMVSMLYGSYGLAGALVAANAVSWAIGTAILSNLVDRFGQRKVMYPAVVVSATALAVTVVFAVFQFPIWALFPPVIISGAAGGSPGAMVRARWNHVLNDSRLLHTAFSLESTLDEITFVIGPVAATALATGVHPAAGLVAPVVVSLIGAKLFYSQRATEPPVGQHRGEHSGNFGSLQRPVVLIPGIAAVVAVNLLIGCLFGAVDVSVVAAATSWDAQSSSGLVLGVFSLTSAAAGFYYGSRAWPGTVSSRFRIGVFVMFVSTLALLAVDSVLLLSIAGAFLGVTIAPTLINGNTLIGRLAPPGRLTEGLAWMGTGIGIGASIGASVSGGLIDQAGYHAGFIAVVAFGTLAALIAAVSNSVLRREPEPAESPT